MCSDKMSTEVTTRHVEKLDGTNFLTWKFEVRAVFVAAGVDDVVDGTRTLMQGADAATTSAWKRDNAKAMVLISTSVERAQLQPLITCTTAKQMWDTLCAVHEQKSASNKLFLTQKFHEYKMAAGDSIVQHVAKVKNMAQQLRDLGGIVDDTTVMAKILASLAPKYSAFRTVWDNIEEKRQTVENLAERLIREEARFESGDDAAEALAVTKNKGDKNKRDGNKNRRSMKNLECYKCKEKGHFARNCPSGKKNKKERDNSETRDYAFVATSNEKGGKSEVRVKNGSFNIQVERVLAADKSEVWLTDSGASRHISYRREWFDEFTPSSGGTVVLGDNGQCEVKGEGTIRIAKYVDGQWHNSRIEGVLYVPQLRKNLFSVGMCTKKGYEVKFNRDTVMITRDNLEIGIGVKQSNSIYRMLFRVINSGEECEANVSAVDLKMWHERLGHVGTRALCDMVRGGLVEGVKLKNTAKFVCEPCQLGKSHRQPFPERLGKRSTEPGECVHTDVCGPIPIESLGGAKYYVTFIDDASGFCYVYFIKQKSDVLEKFKIYEKMVSAKFGRPIRTMRSDNGREYKNSRMKEYLAERGIVMENTAPHTPQQNGKAERANRTIFECARTMLNAKNLPKNLWAEAVSTAVYLLNRTTHSSRKNLKTAYEAWTKRKPNLEHVRIFGSTAYIHVPKLFRGKLDNKAKKVVLVGYQGESSNYRLYDPEKKRVSVSRDVIFDEKCYGNEASDEKMEKQMLTLPKVAKNEGENIAIIEESDEEAEDRDSDRDDDEDRAPEQQAGNGVMKSTSPITSSTARARLRDRTLLKKPSKYIEELDLSEYVPPESYREAVTGTESEEWIEAIKSELRAHEKNKTWVMVPKREDMKLIDSKWVFKVVREKTSDKPRYKARLCARGFLQQDGIDFNETFAPVIRYDSLRMFLARVTQDDLELKQFDVCTAFLHGELEEEILMKIPEGLIVEGGSERMVCQLKKSLYGLKQAPRCWNTKFSGFIKKFGFTESEADSCLYKGVIEHENVFLALFVDDGLIACKSLSVIGKVLKYIEKEFEITVGNANRFVGLQIARNRENKSMLIHQSDYVEKILKKFKMKDAKAVSVPADPHNILMPVDNENEIENRSPYQEAVGSLMFLSVVSRPDITYAVNTVAKFLNKHSEIHWRAVKRIYAYLNGNSDLGIMYTSGDKEPNLVGYCDADYAGDLETRRSTTGYAFDFANGLVSWSSQRQKLVTLSTTESEYVAAATAVKENIWLRNLSKDLGTVCDKATTLYIDNQSAIRLAKNPEYHKRTKHIDVRFHFIREKIASQEIVAKYIPTESQKADIFTKALSKDRFYSLRDSLGLRSYREFSNSERVE